MIEQIIIFLNYANYYKKSVIQAIFMQSQSFFIFFMIDFMQKLPYSITLWRNL